METCNRQWHSIKSGQGNDKFRMFLLKHYSEYTAYRTQSYLHSALVRSILNNYANTQNVYEISDVKLLNKVKEAIRQTEQDLKSHKMYSSAIGRYINYLSIQ